MCMCQIYLVFLAKQWKSTNVNKNGFLLSLIITVNLPLNKKPNPHVRQKADVFLFKQKLYVKQYDTGNVDFLHAKKKRKKKKVRII